MGKYQLLKEGGFGALFRKLGRQKTRKNSLKRRIFSGQDSTEDDEGVESVAGQNVREHCLPCRGTFNLPSRQNDLFG